MGIRGVDIQVAIQRAADAEKIQQGSTSQTRAGEAGVREATEAERAHRQEQTQKSERGDQVIIQTRYRRDRGLRKDQEKEGQDANSQEPDQTEPSDDDETPPPAPRLDILA